MEKIVNCQFCGSESHEYIFDAQDHYTQKNFSLVRCVNCSLIFTNPHPTINELGKYYPPSYYGDAGLRFHPIIEKVVKFYRKQMAKKIDASFPISGRILEIGSGRGTLLSEMAGRGWTAIGTEYSEKLVQEVSKNLDIKVYLTPKLKDCGFPDHYFDVVLCNHVLEHLPDPIQTIYEIHRILQTRGILIIAVPNIGGIIARIFRSHWFGLDVPRHLYHFTPSTLENILSKTGFINKYHSTLSFEQDIFGFAQSTLNLIGFPQNIFYDFIRSPKGRIRHNFSRRKGIHSAILCTVIFFFGGILSIFGLFVSILASGIGMGGTIVYWSYPKSSQLK